MFTLTGRPVWVCLVLMIFTRKIHSHLFYNMFFLFYSEFFCVRLPILGKI